MLTGFLSAPTSVNLNKTEVFVMDITALQQNRLMEIEKQFQPELYRECVLLTECKKITI